MIHNDVYMGQKILTGYKTKSKYNPAEVLEKQVRSANKWKMESMNGDVDPDSFAAKLSIMVRRTRLPLCCGRWMNRPPATR